MSFKILKEKDIELLSICNERAFLNLLIYNKYKGLRVILNDFTIEYYRKKIIEEIIITSLLWIKEKKVLVYKDFVLFSKAILKQCLNKRSNDLYDLKKGNTRSKKEIAIAIIEDELPKIFQLIDFTDAVDIVNGNVEEILDLNEIVENIKLAKKKFYRTYQFKRAFYYQGVVPLILNTNEHYSLILFTNNKYLFEYPECDINISLQILIFKKMFPDVQLNNITIYDTEELKRKNYKFFSGYDLNSLENLFQHLFMLDTATQTKYYGNHCENCLNRGLCYLSNVKEEERLNNYELVRKSPDNANKTAYEKYMLSIEFNKKLFQGIDLDE